MTPQLRLKLPYFQAIASGAKTVEGRLKKPELAALQPGDLIEFISEDDRTMRAEVVYNKEYRSFREMLLQEGIARCLPGLSNLEEGIQIYHSFPGYKAKEKELGVLGIGIRVI